MKQKQKQSTLNFGQKKIPTAQQQGETCKSNETETIPASQSAPSTSSKFSSVNLASKSAADSVQVGSNVTVPEAFAGAESRLDTITADATHQLQVPSTLSLSSNASAQKDGSTFGLASSATSAVPSPESQVKCQAHERMEAKGAEQSSQRPRRSKEATSRHVPQDLVDLNQINLDDYEEMKRFDPVEGDGKASKVKRSRDGTVRGKYKPKDKRMTGVSMDQDQDQDQELIESTGSEYSEKKKDNKRKLNDSGGGDISGSPSDPLALEKTDARAGTVNGCSREDAILLNDDDDLDVDSGRRERKKTKHTSLKRGERQLHSQQLKDAPVPLDDSSLDEVEFISATAKPLLPSAQPNTSRSKGDDADARFNPDPSQSSRPKIAETGLQVKGNLGNGKVAHSFFQKRTKPSKVHSLENAASGPADEGNAKGSHTQPSSASTSASIDKIPDPNSAGKPNPASASFFSSSKRSASSSSKSMAPWPSRDSTHVQPLPSADRASQTSRLPFDPTSVYNHLAFLSCKSAAKGKSKALESGSEESRTILANLIGLDSSASLERQLDQSKVQPGLQAQNFPVPRKGDPRYVNGELIENESDILERLGIGGVDPDRSHPSISNMFFKSISSQSKLRPHLNKSAPPDYQVSSRPACELWTEKHRPRAAEQVLGNEGNSRYLKEWLMELMVEGKVVKAVENANEMSREKDSSFINSKNKHSKSHQTLTRDLQGTKKRRLQKGLEPSWRRKKMKGGHGFDSDDSLDDWIAENDEEEDAAEDPEFDEDAWMMELEKAKQREQAKKKKQKSRFMVDTGSDDENDETGTETSAADSLKQAIHDHPKPGNNHQVSADLASRDQTPASEINPNYPSQLQASATSGLGSDRASSALQSEMATSMPSSSTTTSVPKASLYSDSTVLTNLIILAGPIGSGKTASVFAVAEELGYNVFELNAGSRRGAKELLQEIGEVGRNHQVSGGGNRFIPISSSSPSASLKEKKVNAFDQLFKASKRLKVEATKVEQNNVRDQPEASSSSKTRQSLILIEEADVIYEQDTGFWKGLETFLKTCNRPVIITCTDLDFIPTWDLAIQETLFYRSPPSSIAIPYLQLLAFSEGHLLSSEEVRRLYKSTSLSPRQGVSSLQPFPLTGPLHVYSSLTVQDVAEPQLDVSAEGVEAEKSLDLRSAIMQLQFWCQWAVGFDRMPLAKRSAEMAKWLQSGNDEEGCWSEKSLIGSGFEDKETSKTIEPQAILGGASDDLQKMKQLTQKINVTSWIDSELERGFARANEIFEPDTFKPSADEQLPVQFMLQLYKPSPDPDSTTLAENGREESYNEALTKCCPLASASESHQDDISRFDIDRLYHSRLARTLLLDQSLSPTHYVPSQATLVDYAPCVRRMVRFENQEVRKFNLEEDARIASLLASTQDEQVAGFNLELGKGARNVLGTGRFTRNSGGISINRREYNRWCKVDEDAARAAEKSCLKLEMDKPRQ